ncbi:MAG: extracellular solute-binding protein [Planctomycetes bacterium]|nr:extracellular solute-binding protein [Planctomycetota bacterium]
MRFWRSPWTLGVLAALIGAAVVIGAFVRPDTAMDRRILRYTMYKYEAYDKFRRKAGKEFEDQWNARHDEKILVKYEPIGTAYTQKINAEVVANTLHDLFFIPVGAFYDFIEKGVLLDLTPFIEARDDWDRLNQMYPKVLEECSVVDAAGKRRFYCLPGNLNTDGLYYNKTLFDRAGVAYPDETWTWEDVRQAARKLTVRDASGRIVQFGLIFTNDLPTVFLTSGATVFADEARTRTALDSPQAVQAVEFFHKLVWDDRVSPTPAEAATEQGTDSFKNGHAAMVVGGRWYTALFKPIADLDFRVAPLPIGFDGRRVSRMGFNKIGISARTRHPEIAYQLLLHLNSPEQVRNVINEGDSLPLRPGGPNSRPFVEDPVHQPGGVVGANRAFLLAIERDDVVGNSFWETPNLPGTYVGDTLAQCTEEIFSGPGSDVKAILGRYGRTVDAEIARHMTPPPPARVGRFVAVLAVVLLAGLGALVLYLRYRGRSPAPGEARPAGRGSDLRRSPLGYLFILPNICGFALFTLLPVAFSLVLAFTDWNLLSWPPRFVGFSHFATMLHSADFWKYFWNTTFLMGGIPIGMAGSLLLAVVLNQKLRGRMVFRSVFFLPSFTAGVAIFMLWLWIYNSEYGLLNKLLLPALQALQHVATHSPRGLWTGLGWGFWLLSAFWAAWFARRLWEGYRHDDASGLMSAVSMAGVLAVALAGYFAGWALMNLPAAAAAGLEPPRWLTGLHEVSLGPLFGHARYRFDWAKPAFVLVGLWAGVGGFNMVLYLAALQGISPHLYEAASIDGATRWQQFKSITWPLLSPTTFFIFVMSVIGGFNGGFEAAFVMTQGGPQGATTTLSYHIYQNAFQWYRMGYAAALAWMLFVVVFIVTLINWRFGGRQVHV